MKSDTKILNVRLSPTSFASLQQVATANGSSLNRAVEASIEAMADMIRKRLREAFAQIAEAEHDVEFAYKAQAEVALGSEQ